MIRVPARSTVYIFAFLASVVSAGSIRITHVIVCSPYRRPLQAIHRDAFGSKPRATLFATEGLKLIDASLAGSACKSRVQAEQVSNSSRRVVADPFRPGFAFLPTRLQIWPH